MEAFAAYLSHTDHELGRLFDRLRALGELDNTLVVVLSDNGASSEGGPDRLAQRRARCGTRCPARSRRRPSASTRSAGRGSTTTTRGDGRSRATRPFRRWKRETHEGGVADPLIVHWPDGIAARGEVRHQYVHAIDLLPTILDAIGIEPPTEVAGVDAEARSTA